MLTCVFCFCLCLVCFESRRQPLRLVEALDSLVLNLLRVFTESLEEDLVFHRRSTRLAWLWLKVKKVRNSLTWFSHGSGAASAPVPLRRVSFST